MLQELLSFIDKEQVEQPLVKKKIVDDSFNLWWKSYPGTDTFKQQ